MFPKGIYSFFMYVQQRKEGEISRHRGDPRGSCWIQRACPGSAPRPWRHQRRWRPGGSPDWQVLPSILSMLLLWSGPFRKRVPEDSAASMCRSVHALRTRLGFVWERLRERDDIVMLAKVMSLSAVNDCLDSHFGGSVCEDLRSPSRRPRGSGPDWELRA